MGAWEIAYGRLSFPMLALSRTRILFPKHGKADAPSSRWGRRRHRYRVRRGNVFTEGPLRTVRIGRFMPRPWGVGRIQRVADVSRETPVAVRQVYFSGRGAAMCMYRSGCRDGMCVCACGRGCRAWTGFVYRGRRCARFVQEEGHERVEG